MDGAARLASPTEDRLLGARPSGQGRRATAARSAAAALALLLLALALRLWGRDLLDGPVMGLLGRISHRSLAFDLALRAVDRFALFQGVPLFGLAFAAFVASGAGATRVRMVLACIAAAGAAALSRVLQLGLPHLPRPLFDPALGYRAPYGADFSTLADWSSFPSDHAALLFGVALAVLAASRRYGLAALALAGVVCFARVYGGEHYPSDIAGGALLAAACVHASGAAPASFYAAIGARAARRRALLAGIAFVGAAEAAALFDDVRGVASHLLAHLG